MLKNVKDLQAAFDGIGDALRRLVGRVVNPQNDSRDPLKDQDFLNSDGARYSHTVLSEYRLDDSIDRSDGDSYFQGRRIIKRDAPVLGGVSIGAGTREAIVVDVEKYVELANLYQSVLEKSKDDSGAVNRSKILMAVYEVVDQTFQYREPRDVYELNEKLDVENDGKVSLDRYISNRTGVCRHMALTCCALLEMAKNDGHIRGQISFDRNSWNNGGHGWCRYTTHSGTVYILDVMQEYFGPISETNINSNWSYRRPTDK